MNSCSVKLYWTKFIYTLNPCHASCKTFRMSEITLALCFEEFLWTQN